MTCRFIALFPSYPASNTQVVKIGDSTGLFCRIQEQSDTATCEMIHFEDHPVRCPQWTPFGFRRIRIAVEERHFILAIGEIIYRAQAHAIRIRHDFRIRYGWTVPIIVGEDGIVIRRLVLDGQHRAAVPSRKRDVGIASLERRQSGEVAIMQCRRVDGDFGHRHRPHRALRQRIPCMIEIRADASGMQTECSRTFRQ